MSNYEFNPERAYDEIKEQWRRWAEGVGAKRFVFGVSGGKDSTVIAYLAARIVGPNRCYGVMMANGTQPDIGDSERVISLTGIHGLHCNIGTAFDSLVGQVKKNFLECSERASINLAPRLRMATLYAVAQTVDGFVLNTDNLSERILGYFTAYGDGAGDYAPLRGLTATEVVRLGEWLGVPDALIHKKPGDGLQALCDEDRFGFTYADLDRLIRTGEGSQEFRDKIRSLYRANRFKTDIVNIPGPQFPAYPDYVSEQ